MQTNALATTLKKRYEAAPAGGQVVAIYLFGTEFADALDGQPLKDICAMAGLSQTYATELSKARRLAPFVQLKK